METKEPIVGGAHKKALGTTPKDHKTNPLWFLHNPKFYKKGGLLSLLAAPATKKITGGDFDDCSEIMKKNGTCIPESTAKRLIGESMQGGNDTDEAIKKHFKAESCGTLACVASKIEETSPQDKDKAETLRQAAKQQGPGETTEWFSNENIDNEFDKQVVKERFPQLRYIKFSMIDFAQTGSELEKMNFYAEHTSRTTNSPIKHTLFVNVLNTDKSSGSGKHWFAICIDVKDSPPVVSLEYLNSAGDEVLTEIDAFFTKVEKQFEASPLKYTFIRKPAKGQTLPQLQYDKHSCGAYSMYFVWQRAQGKSQEEIYEILKNTDGKTSDAAMVEFRERLFK